jgi:hypothetical protein
MLGAAPQAAAQFVYSVPGAEIAAQLQKTFAGTTLKLHSRGPIVNGSTYAANASSIKVPQSAGGLPGQRTYFSLPDESRVFAGRRYGYYVDRVSSNGLFVASGDDTLTFTLTLASPGPAVVGTCVRVRSPVGPCATLGEEGLPAVEWRDARVDLVVKPVLSGSAVALDVQSVVIGGSFDYGKTCEWPLLGARLCAMFNRQADRLRTRIAAQVKDVLNSAAVRRQVAAGVREYLDTTLQEPLLAVRAISMQQGIVSIAVGLRR